MMETLLQEGLRSFVQQMKICEFYFILSSKKVMLQYNVLYIKHITGERGSMLNFIRGFCMALADSVPGVSGGTVAFLLGFMTSLSCHLII